MDRHYIAHLCCLLGLFALSVNSVSAQSNDASLELFEKHVRPMLLDQCIRCHGPKKQKGGLRVDSRDWLFKGGDSGAVVHPGDPKGSLLAKAIRYDDPELEMPPRGKLPQTTVAALERWIETGAVDPRTSQSAESEMGSEDQASNRPPSVEDGRNFWSFRPIADPVPPKVNDPDWPITSIDRFVLARLEQQEILPVATASRETLIRRAFFDLIGLPPTPDQIKAFMQDESPNAYENLVDRLLESQQFGERWGRRWLDVVRYAESSGGGRTLLFPNAWRYRDYVFEAFNNDLRYDQFLREQLAGDLIDATDWKDKRRKLTATAFLLLGPTNYELQDKDVLEMDVVDEQLDTIGKSMMGMTIGCARCHDHKFDPIPAEDYYALAGILKSTKAMIHSNVSTWNKVDLPVSPDEEVTLLAHDAKLAELEKQIESTTKQIKNLGGKFTRKNRQGGNVKSTSLDGVVLDDKSAELIGQWTPSTSIRSYVNGQYIHDGTAEKGSKHPIFRPKLPEAGDYEIRVAYAASANRSENVPVTVRHANGDTIVRVNQKKQPDHDGLFTSVGVFTLNPEDDIRVTISNDGTEDGVVIVDAVQFLLDNHARRENEKQRQVLNQELAKRETELEREKKSGPQRSTGMVTGDDEDAGDIHLAIRGVVHNRGGIVPRGVMQVAATNPRPQIASGESGRRELADWIASPTHPLTARVMVNRVWYWLMGRGIVSTVDNFGSMGAAPTHPELLDYMATQFIKNNWSTKRLIREIMRSKIYQLSTINDVNAQSVDPDNHLFWRMHRKRLHAEDIRDSLLYVAGTLDERFGGDNIAEGTSSEYGYRFISKRRSVYLPVFRNTLPEIFEVFDFADPNIQSGSRTQSTIASQALLLMNHPMVIDQSREAAKRLMETTPISDEAAIEHAYLQVLARTPTEREQQIALEFVGAERDKEISYGLLYQTLFQCVDFRYLN